MQLAKIPGHARWDCTPGLIVGSSAVACSALPKPVNAQVCLWNLRTGAQRRVISAALAGGSSRDPSAPQAVLTLGNDAVAATCGRQARCSPVVSTSDSVLTFATSNSFTSGLISCCLQNVQRCLQAGCI